MIPKLIPKLIPTLVKLPLTKGVPVNKFGKTFGRKKKVLNNQILCNFLLPKNIYFFEEEENAYLISLSSKKDYCDFVYVIYISINSYII